MPTLLELAKGSDKEVVDFVASATPVSRALAYGPGVPADRVAVLRAAMEKTMKDPAFLAEAKKRKLPLRPRSWQELTQLVNKIVDAPESLVDRVKKMTGQ